MKRRIDVASLLAIGGGTAWGALSLPTAAQTAEQLLQAENVFDRDPGWEAHHNHVVATDGPTIHQDFGWSQGAHG